MSTRTFPLMVAALFGASCGSGDMHSSLDHYSDELSASVQGVQEALSTHQDQVLQQNDLGRIRELERRHTDDMTERMAHMRAARNSMGACEDYMRSSARDAQSLRDETDNMMQAMDDTAAEISRHAQAMHNAVDVDAALTEERQHRSATDQIIDHMLTIDTDMMRAMRSMMDHGMSMMCPMNSHMHAQF